MAVEGDGEDAAHDDRREWRRSNWIQAALIFGSIGMVIALDWVLNRHLTYVAPVLIAIPLGLAVGAVLLIRRRRSGRR